MPLPIAVPGSTNAFFANAMSEFEEMKAFEIPSPLANNFSCR